MNKFDGYMLAHQMESIDELSMENICLSDYLNAARHLVRVLDVFGQT